MIVLIVVCLCLDTLRMGDYLFNFPHFYLILLLDVLGMLCIRYMGDLEYGMDLLPFMAVITVTMMLQFLLAGPYYDWTAAMVSVITMLAIVLCIILVTQKGCGCLIWRIINFFNLFAAGCILLQMALRSVGIRLDQMGMFSNLFFNAWEFTTVFRPCGPFKEAAMFAQPALLSLFYYLFIGRSWKKALFLTAALVLSTSAMGMLGVLLLCLAWFLHLDHFFSIRRSTKWILLIAVVLLMVLFLALSMDAGIYVVQRMLSGSSIGLRLFRSVDLYGLMSPVEKLTGIGIQNQQNYLNYYSIILEHDTYETTIGASREPAGALGYILCTTGFFGLLSFVYPFYRTFVQGNLQVRIMVLLFLCCTTFSAMFMKPSMMVCMLAVYATVDLSRSGAFAERGGYE